jgi:hypothetical protein
VPDSQRAFPYGGIDLARLFDGRQEVAANIGGRPPAAFGLVVHDRGGRRVLATQRPRIRLGGRPLRLTRAPAGATARVLLPRPQSSNPRPGPTLAVELLRRSATGRVVMAVRLQTGRKCAPR